MLAGRVTGTDLITVRGQRVLVVNRMPTDDGGAVATLRDRTELEQLGRELDSTHGLIDALRAQDHEHANRMHTLLGLLELEMYDDAVEFVGEVVGDHRATAEQVTEKIQDPLLAALLVGKATVAAERGVALWVSDRTRLPDRLIDPRGLVTIVGNLVDNALDAVAGTAARARGGRTARRGPYRRTAGAGHRPRHPGRAARVDLHRGLVHQEAAGARQARDRPLPGAQARRAAGRQRVGGRCGRRGRRVHRRPARGADRAGPGRARRVSGPDRNRTAAPAGAVEEGSR